MKEIEMLTQLVNKYVLLSDSGKEINELYISYAVWQRCQGSRVGHMWNENSDDHNGNRQTRKYGHEFAPTAHTDDVFERQNMTKTYQGQPKINLITNRPKYGNGIGEGCDRMKPNVSTTQGSS